jgi:hypothetical protein
MTSCELASLNMGGPSSIPIKCANQDSEIKDPCRGIGPEGNNERKKIATAVIKLQQYNNL